MPYSPINSSSWMTRLPSKIVASTASFPYFNGQSLGRASRGGSTTQRDPFIDVSSVYWNSRALIGDADLSFRERQQLLERTFQRSQQAALAPSQIQRQLETVSEQVRACCEATLRDEAESDARKAIKEEEASSTGKHRIKLEQSESALGAEFRGPTEPRQGESGAGSRDAQTNETELIGRAFGSVAPISVPSVRIQRPTPGPEPMGVAVPTILFPAHSNAQSGLTVPHPVLRPTPASTVTSSNSPSEGAEQPPATSSNTNSDAHVSLTESAYIRLEDSGEILESKQNTSPDFFNSLMSSTSSKSAPQASIPQLPASSDDSGPANIGAQKPRGRQRKRAEQQKQHKEKPKKQRKPRGFWYYAGPPIPIPNQNKPTHSHSYRVSPSPIPISSTFPVPSVGAEPSQPNNSNSEPYSVSVPHMDSVSNSPAPARETDRDSQPHQRERTIDERSEPRSHRYYVGAPTLIQAYGVHVEPSTNPPSSVPYAAQSQNSTQHSEAEAKPNQMYISTSATYPEFITNLHQR